MTWAVYDGDVPIMLVLRSILGWRTTAWWRSRAPWGIMWDTGNVQRWKHRVVFHNRGEQWDTPLARWAGEGKDWIKLMAQTQFRREDVFLSLFESMKQAVEKKKEPNGTRPTKKPRDLRPLELGIPEARQCPTLEIKGDCTTIVDEQLVSRDTGQKRNILKRSKSAWRCWIFHQKEAAATAGTDPTKKRTARSRSRLSSGSQEQEG